MKELNILRKMEEGKLIIEIGGGDTNALDEMR